MSEELIITVIGILLPLALGFGIGRWRERSHLASLARREADNTDMIVTNLKIGPDPQSVRGATFVSGGAVIATDYFKTFAAALRRIIGGEMRSYETLMNRARREATLRMLEEARQVGATEIWNIRFDTSNILSATSKNKAASVEVFASGTAIIR
ncbi:MAG TPA: heavy metal-binding domain-containing protein [Phycisphaerae bacterium]|nr:heavy metal-binding domain-containing protein [Phycisphaerae bacterium]